MNTIRLTRRETLTRSLKLTGASALAFAAVRTSGLRALAQGTSGDLTSLGLPELDVTVTGSSYEGLPSQVNAGLYLVKATNSASAQSFIAFMNLPEGMTVPDLKALLGGGATPVAGSLASPEAGAENQGPPPWYYTTYLAGGAGIPPNGSATFVVDLKPGNYAVWGEDPSATQAPLALTVTSAAASPAAAAAPTADVTIHEQATDTGFAFGIDNQFVTGSQVVEIDNDSKQPHFVEIDKLPDGTTLEDVMKLLQSEMSGTPAAGGGLSDRDIQPFYFVATQSADTKQWHQVSFDPGTYALLCFIGDIDKGGVPHAMEGMVNVFTVTGPTPATPTS